MDGFKADIPKHLDYLIGVIIWEVGLCCKCGSTLGFGGKMQGYLLRGSLSCDHVSLDDVLCHFKNPHRAAEIGGRAIFVLHGCEV